MTLSPVCAARLSCHQPHPSFLLGTFSIGFFKGIRFARFAWRVNHYGIQNSLEPAQNRIVVGALEPILRRDISRDDPVADLVAGSFREAVKVLAEVLVHARGFAIGNSDELDAADFLTQGRLRIAQLRTELRALFGGGIGK